MNSFLIQNHFLLLIINLIIRKVNTVKLINCNQDGYKLKDTIGFGMIDENWYQLTINIELVKYEMNYKKYIQLSKGLGDLLDEKYPDFGKNQKYYAYISLKEANPQTDVSFANQKLNNLNYIVLRIIDRSKQIVYTLKEPFSNSLSNQLEMFEHNFNNGEIDRIIPIWLDPITSLVKNIALVNNLNTKQVDVYDSIDLNSGPIGVLCSETIDYDQHPKLIWIKNVNENCNSLFDFISKIHFAYTKDDFVYLVSLKIKLVFYFKMEMFNEINRPQIVKKIPTKNLFKCNIDDSDTPDLKLSSKSILGNIIVISLLVVIILPILISIALYFYYGIYQKKMIPKLILQKRKIKKQKNENVVTKFSIKKIPSESVSSFTNDNLNKILN